METPTDRLTERDIILLLDAVMTASDDVAFSSPGLMKGVAGLVEQLVERSGMLETTFFNENYAEAQESAIIKFYNNFEN